MFTTNSKFLETTPNSVSVILVMFEDHWSDAAHKMTQSGKHGIYSVEYSVFSDCPNSLNTFPKIFQLMEGYILKIWNSLESVSRLSQKFRRRFCVFQIVSF